MKNLILIFLFFIASFKTFAQCKTGNCTTGTGTYDYGWCVYSGEFKNGKPEGKGTMKYDDYSYTGNFTNGLEDGEGLITNKDGTKENVQYTAGKKYVSQLAKIPEAEYKPLDPQDKNCLNGNCITGYGTYQFLSGNKYIGNFKDRKREGQGVFYFASGDKFEGYFSDNEKTSGTYFFSTGAKYTGTYDNKGMELNGMITSVAGMSIPYVNGVAIVPPPPKIPKQTEQDPGRPKVPQERIKMTCSVCHGTGKQSRLEDWSGPTITHLVRVYDDCWKCHGSGVE